MTDLAFQRCINPRCGATVDLADTAFRCPKCGGLLDVAYDWDRLPVPKSLAALRGASGRTAPTRSTSPACGGSANCSRSPRTTRS